MGYSKRGGVTGPLVAYRDGFVEDLAGRGYTTASAMRQVCLLADLSRWLERRALGAGDPTPAEILVQEYRAYLAHERRLAVSSIERYLGPARLFVSERERRDGLDLEHLTASDVTAFVVSQCRTRRRGSAKVLVTALRSLLRFLFLQGCTTCPLAQAVPTAAGWADQSLPRALGADAVTALLNSCDRHTDAGMRDFAILTLLARLGLRAGEVAALTLEDIDWHHGEMVVRGKGGRRERLPLPADVGEAVVTYLRHRPGSACRALKVRAPVTGLSSDGVQDVVRGACLRAGLPPAGAHRLRHHAATAMLACGASLTEVGQVLRHDRLVTTSLYAKVDRAALRSIAQPWPGGAR